MTPLRVHGETRRLAESQPEYTPLSIRDELVELVVEGRRVVVNGMTAAFEPTPDELERLNKGAPVALRILGVAWPPVKIWVGEAPE